MIYFLNLFSVSCIGIANDKTITHLLGGGCKNQASLSWLNGLSIIKLILGEEEHGGVLFQEYVPENVHLEN